MQTCEEHRGEAATGRCRSCGGSFCELCFVYAFGRLKPPYCIHCALLANGLEVPGASGVERRTLAS